MKTAFYTSALLLFLLVFGCESEEEEELYTGREVKYEMLKGAFFEHETTGYILIKERIDQSIDIEINMEGTLPNAYHPVHLHYGSLEDDGLVAEFLTYLEDTGNRKSQSITHIKYLRNEDTPITFDRFLEMDASIKVHMEESGEYKDVILGASDIGKNYSIQMPGSNKAITICNSKTSL
jgi:hypothetical protein